LYGDLFGLGRKIAQVATEKRRFDILDTFNQILEELYKTDENLDETNRSMNESDQRTINNPYIVKSKGRPRNKRFKSSVEMSKTSKNSSSSSNACSNCNSTNHNIRRCTAPCKLCNKEGHTYTRCKGKNIENS
jgi:hypothetical protein